MRPFITFTSLLALSASVLALPVIKIKDNAFFVEDTDERFYIRGVDYQPGGSSNLTDPLTDPEICKRDIPHFQDLGLNTIRVYSVDNTLDHTECMNMLNDAGIYVILDINTPDASISRHDAACSYNLQYITELFATVDDFVQYNNTLGFFSANELVNNVENFQYSPYIKAVTRDLKQYMRAKNYRAVPIGYSSADVSSIRYDLANYLNCGDDADERIDMLGLNDYSWCGHSSFALSGYKQKVEGYSGYSIPIFMSEYGCNEVVDNRPFTEIEAIYSTQMSSVYSGGLVYEYFQYVNDYGLVSVDNDTVTELTDYNNLKSMLASVTNPVGDGGAASYNYSSCPTGLNFSLAVPEQPKGLTELIKSGPNGNNYGFEANTQDACWEDDEVSVSSSSSSSSSSQVSSSKISSSSSRMSSSTIRSSTRAVASSSSSNIVSSISSTSHKNNANGSILSVSNMWSILALAASIINL